MSEPRKPLPIAAMIVAGLAAFGGGAGVVYMLMSGAPEPAAIPEPKLAVGELYHVFVESLEMAPRGPEGEPWDVDDSAPDPGYEIHWKGQRVFESTEVTDSLIARWSGMKIGFETAAALITQGKADPAQVVDAALMRVEEGAGFVLHFSDRDVTTDEAAGQVEVAWSDLVPGPNVLKSATPDRGWSRASLRVVQSSSDLFKVLESLRSERP